MRYADMLSKLDHDWPEKDIPSGPDAVHVLEPMVDGCEGWLKHSNVAPTLDHINGVYGLDFLQEARPLPKEFVPASLTIQGYNPKYIEDQKPLREWPAGLPQVMPDFYLFRNNEYIVSSLARDVFEAASPGAIEYIEIQIKTPPHLIRSPSYYHINVLPQAQQIDWSKAGKTPKPGSRSPLLSGRSKEVPFKPLSANDPIIWHEMDLDEQYRFSQSCVLIRGSLWNTLIQNFPLQLAPNRISKDA